MANKTEIFQESSGSGEFKTCVNGHYYQGATCPFCKGNSNSRNLTSDPTDIITEFVNTNNSGSGGGFKKTQPTQSSSAFTAPVNPKPNSTVFGDDETETYTGGPMEGANPDLTTCCSHDHTPRGPRFSRKLVGWLVSYSNDSLGMDYKLFEGRNIIGRDMDCNISVNDGRVSGKHAVLLFRAGKYSITDTQSSHGTFVNDEDIELEPRYINDGDIIRVGNTTFKFRTSL